jgi:hypothetical protein
MIADAHAKPRIVLQTASITVGVFANVYIMRVHGEVLMDDLLAAHKQHLALIAGGRESTGVLTIAQANAPIPKADVREASGRLMRELTPHLLAGATVIEGGGFWASAVRSFLTAVYFVARQPCPTKAFGRVEEAAAWLGARVGQIPSQVTGAADFVVKRSPSPGAPKVSGSP